MKWEVESFTPSDGSKQGGITIDHTAWLRGHHPDIPTVHVSLNMSSRGVPTEKARAYLDAMVTGLNRLPIE